MFRLFGKGTRNRLAHEGDDFELMDKVCVCSRAKFGSSEYLSFAGWLLCCEFFGHAEKLCCGSGLLLRQLSFGMPHAGAFGVVCSVVDVSFGAPNA